MKEIHDIDLKEIIESETREKFNKDGYIKCPFHNEKTPSMSVKFFSNANRYRYKCWGCGETGDAIDFIKKYRNVSLTEARTILGISHELTDKEKNEEKVKSYIDWQLKEFKSGYKLLGLFTFVDELGNDIYYKAKFIKPDGKKETPYYSINNGKVINKRNHEEVPYNLQKVIEGIEEDKIIVFLEGEKDVNTVSSILYGTDYIATSIKGCKESLDIIKREGIRVYVLGDTGEAGEKYKKHIYNEFFDISSEFKFINLPYVSQLGDNKDVTDWLDAGHNRVDLLKAFSRSLDLKSTFDLQQDFNGIYKAWHDDKTDEDKKYYITDFQIISAKRLRLVEEDREGIKLTLKSATGETIERSGVSTVFDDIRSFKNFLGTMDLSFTSKNIEDLTKLKTWINKFWAIENSLIYPGDKFVVKDGKLNLITGDGAVGIKGNDYSLVSNSSDVNIMDVEEISKNELELIKQHLFNFVGKDKAYSIIGTVINDLLVYQNEQIGEKIHHLLIVGESQSGKSTILERIIAPILNYSYGNKKSISTTPFAIVKDLSTGNYPTLYDEFKPSTMDKYKVQKLSNIFRNLYDRQIENRGDKSFKVKSFQLARPLIMAGEESYPNQEVACITRSCIVYLSRNERTASTSESFNWLINNTDILRKFGKSLIKIVLELPVDEYRTIWNSRKDFFSCLGLKERSLSTAANISTGIEIFNKLCSKYGLTGEIDYEKYIFANIKEEILDGSSDTRSTIEQMLILYNSMIEDGKAVDVKNVIRDNSEGLYIRTSEMINQIFLFCKQYESAEVIPLKLRDFKKQANKSGYLVKSSAKLIRVDEKPVRFDEYSKSKIQALKLNSICEPDLLEFPVDKTDEKRFG